MEQVERVVKLPSGAGPLSHYKRFYAYGNDGDVLGLFLGGDFVSDSAAKRQWVEDYKSFPLVSDGGCGVVNLRFNLKTSKSESWCNGVA